MKNLIAGFAFMLLVGCGGSSNEVIMPTEPAAEPPAEMVLGAPGSEGATESADGAPSDSPPPLAAPGG